MPQPTQDIVRVVRQAGLTDDQVSVDELREVDAFLSAARADPIQTTAELLMAHRRVRAAKRSCAKAATAAKELQQLLEQLLDANPLLCRVEDVSLDAESARATCRINGQLRELPVHPEVDLERLRALQPWELVLVHPDEMLVIGICGHPDQLARSRGEIVEFRAYYDESQGQAWVARAGQGDEVITLAGRLRDLELAPSDKLVLLYDDERWAIDRVEAERVRSRFEVPIDQLDTNIEDLAGLDEIIDALLEDLSLRVLNPEVREQFALEPLSGLLLYSYKPGMGKTALMRAFARLLDQLGREQGFEVVLHVVRPNALKSHWHGGDAKLVREELCGSIRARASAPRTQPLFQIVVMDEIDSLGKRGGEGEITSSASNDAVQALLAEMDGMVPQAAAAGDGPPAHVLWCGLTNRPDLLDEALKRPGRFGDLVLEIPAADREAAARILAIHGVGASLPWYLGEELCTGVSTEALCTAVTRPAIATVFDKVVLRYSTDGRADVELTAGEALASVHFKQAMNVAKKKAGLRLLRGVGLPAVALDDVIDGLIGQACAAARQMDADRAMFRRQMKIEERVTRLSLVPEEELRAHRYFQPHRA